MFFIWAIFNRAFEILKGYSLNVFTYAVSLETIIQNKSLRPTLTLLEFVTVSSIQLPVIFVEVWDIREGTVQIAHMIQRKKGTTSLLKMVYSICALGLQQFRHFSALFATFILALFYS